jgi:hypothetical protein
MHSTGTRRLAAPVAFLTAAVLTLFAAACSHDSTGPSTPTGDFQFTSGQLHSLDSAVQVAAASNPGNTDLKTLLDSAVEALTVGVQARRLDVNTDLTGAPMFFVGIHRAYAIAGGTPFSTWTVLGFDDPSHVTTMIDVGGYLAGGATAPSAVSGGLAGGVGNARFFQIAAGGATTEWFVNSGTASFSSDASASRPACPGFTATAHVTCSIETLHVHFDAQSAGGSNGAGARHATLGTDVDLPAMRLDYTF